MAKLSKLNIQFDNCRTICISRMMRNKWLLYGLTEHGFLNVKKSNFHPS